jgi:hypothetical protein
MGTVFIVLLVLAVIVGLSLASKIKTNKSTGAGNNPAAPHSGRLLEKRTSKGGIIVWVPDLSQLMDNTGYVNKRTFEWVTSKPFLENSPIDWVAAMAAAETGKDTLSFDVRPATSGGFEIWIDASNIKPSKSKLTGGFQVGGIKR